MTLGHETLRAALFALCLAALLVIGAPPVLAQDGTDAAKSDAAKSDSDHQNWLERAYQSLSPEWGGHVKVRGRVSHTADDSFYAPVGTGNYYDTYEEFRLKNKVYFGDWGYFETHYEAALEAGDTRRKNQELKRLDPSVFNGGLVSSGPISDDNRLFDLTGTISSDDSYVLAQRLDRLYLAWQPDWGTVKLGRQALTWGNGMLFNPMDLFNPFAPTDFTRDYKIGDDMATVQFSTGDLGWQGLFVPRRDPEHDVDWNYSSTALKWQYFFGDTETDLMVARHYEDYVVGLAGVGTWGGAAWRVNVTYTQQDGQGESGGYLSAVANMDYSWMWWGKNWYGWAELYFNGLGDDDYAQALEDPAIVERLERGELFVLGRTYFDAEVKFEAHPLVDLYCTVIVNLYDPSGILQPRVDYNVTQNGTITAGGNVYFGGPGSEYGGFRPQGSQYFLSRPDSAYLWYTYYF